MRITGRNGLRYLGDKGAGEFMESISDWDIKLIPTATPTEPTEGQAAWLNALPDASGVFTGYFSPGPDVLAWFEAEEALREAARVEHGDDRPDVEGS